MDKNDFYISMISTEDFCISINNIIKSILDIDVKIYKDKKMVLSGNNITSIIYYKGNRRAEKVMDWLYKDATIYLERKHNKYLELKSWIKEVDGRTSRYSK